MNKPVTVIRLESGVLLIREKPSYEVGEYPIAYLTNEQAKEAGLG